MKSSNNFACPSPQPHWVIREEIIGKLRRAVLSKRHYFLSAPGGYGKTVATAQFMNSVGGNTAWVKIEEDDREEAYFYKRLLRAIGLIIPQKTYRSALANYKGDYTLSAVLELLSHLSSSGKRCYLVIDDIHLASQELKQAIPIIIDRLPAEYITVGLLSRRGILPNLTNIKLFTAKDLTFSLDEVEQLISGLDNKTIERAPSEIIGVTNGWILGILVLIMGDILPGKLESGSASLLKNYITKYIWNLWNKETQSFLLCSAFIPLLTPKVCEFLTGDKHAKQTLEHIYENNAFLSKNSDGTYVFHDLFREFLQQYAKENLPKKEIYTIRNKSADWLFGGGHFLSAAKLYIDNRDHEGINKCIVQASKQQSNVSLDSFLSFSREIILPLPNEMLEENYNLLVERAWYAFLTGNKDTFIQDMGVLFERQEEVAQKTSEVMERFIFMGSLYYNVSLHSYAQWAMEQLSDVPEEALYLEHDVNSSAITHNLPYFHRSMRDFSEYSQLLEDDFNVLRKSFGKMIGKEYLIMELCLKSGILYEQNQLYKALELALKAYENLGAHSGYETVFCTTMLLASIFESLMAEEQVKRLYFELSEYVKIQPANTLNSNYIGMVTIREISGGNKKAAEHWLESHLIETTPYLSFYRLGWHYTTLKSYLAIEDYNKAISFGHRLQEFGRDYHRPLDLIESSILLSIAYDKNKNKKNAIKALQTALKTAAPYNYTRLFINNSSAIIGNLATLKMKKSLPKKKAIFLERILEELGRESGISRVVKKQKFPPPKRQAILEYIAQGLSYNEIAEKTELTRGTVKNHIRLLYKDLDVSSAQQAVHKGKILGLIK